VWSGRYSRVWHAAQHAIISGKNHDLISTIRVRIGPPIGASV